MVRYDRSSMTKSEFLRQRSSRKRKGEFYRKAKIIKKYKRLIKSDDPSLIENDNEKHMTQI